MVTIINEACAISPCNTRFAAGGDDGIIYLYNKESSVSLLTIYPAHMARVNDVAFSHDGSMMCSAGKDGKIVIYTNTTKHVLYLPEFKLPVKDYGNLFEEEIESNLPKMIEVFSLVWTCDDTRIVCASSDYLVRVCYSHTGKQY